FSPRSCAAVCAASGASGWHCTASSKYNGLLSFHGFPSDPDLRRQWLANIRRDKLKLTQHTKVCSLHFTPDQLLQPKAAGGRRVVSRGAVPVLFSWSHRSVQPPRAGLRRPDSRAADPPVGFTHLDHDYCSVPEPANLDGAENENQKLKEDMNALKEQAGELEIPPSFGLQRFAGSDDDIRFYTRANGNKHYIMLLEGDSLQPIDELLLFQMYLAAGLKEGDLANRFQIQPSTASRIICSWADYLYSLLGSLCIWADADAVRAQLPEDFRDFPDTQVIVGSSELRCQTPASALLQTEMSSKSKCHFVMRGLTGTAPHGAVTFVSSLYEGSVSDTELFMRSGLADRLTEDMAVMVDEGFLVSDCVKCKVYCPPFLSTKPQMTSPNVLQTQKVARLRVHIERVTRRVKENKLFDSVIPLSMITIHTCSMQFCSISILIQNHFFNPNGKLNVGVTHSFFRVQRSMPALPGLVRLQLLMQGRPEAESAVGAPLPTKNISITNSV
uniref:THAP-type domain-containing protein n=1 Tax=Xiphophorus couchianus TaxID=32473 RepID=A0A3B5MC68_9TELE